MNASDPRKELVHSFYEEVWNKGNFDYIDEIYADDFQLTALWQNTSLGRSGNAATQEAKGTIQRWLDGFPDMHLTVEDMIAEGEFVASRHLATGTQAKEFMGLPNTGKRGVVSGITINRVHDGKIAQTWTCWDAAGMMIQLGIAPPPPDVTDPEETAAAWEAGQANVSGDATGDEAKEIVARLYREVWSEGKLNVVGDLYADGFVGRGPAVRPLRRGPEGAGQFIAEFRAGLPDLKIEVHAQHAEGGRVVTRFSGRGTHQGFWLGVQPTGKEINLSGVALTRVANGKIAASWSEIDVIGLLQQLGAIPAPGGAPARS